MHVSILVPQSSVMQAIADPHYLFNTINQFLQSQGKKPRFVIELVAANKNIALNESRFNVEADRSLNEITKTDLIIIPALFGSMPQAIDANRNLIPWILEHRRRGAEIASLCVGAFLLGSTGLLDGKKCSTHWGFANEFRTMFPKIELVDGTVITEDSGIYTSGGANSYWNLLLHLVEKYTSRDLAILASKYFAVDIDRDSQNAYMMFQGQKNHGDKEIIGIQRFIEDNPNEKLNIDELAQNFNLSRRSLERRFKSATNNTVLEYIQRIRIENAKRSFEGSRKNIAEVMYDVGYSDSKTFRQVFRKVTGLTPIEYRNKYNKWADN
jgi:transcriptional regulator GlxA family with amidase domain